MTPEQWRHVTTVFHAALARDEDARSAFLDDACREDPLIRAEVERLLVAHDDAGAFGDAPVAAGLSTGFPTVAPSTASTEIDAAPAVDDSAGEATDSPRPRHPFRWIVAFAALVALAAFSDAAWLLIRGGATAKAFGWTEGRGGRAIITAVDPDGPAAGRVEVGDRIIALNGSSPFGGGGTTFHRRRLSVGDTYRLALDRNGTSVDTTLTVGRGPSRLAHHITYFLMSLVWTVVGIFIGVARPDDRVARVAFGAAVTTGVGYLVVAVLDVANFFNPLHVVLGVHFFSIFPSGRVLTGPWKWCLALGYAVAMLPVSTVWWIQGTFLFHGVPGVAAFATSHPALMALRGPVAVNTFYVCLAGMVGAAVYNYRRLTDDNERRRVKWVAYGSTASLAPQVFLSVAELAGNPLGLAGEWVGRFADAATAGIPLAMAYAVVKHRVLDIRVVVRRGLQYVLAKGALQALVALPILVLAYTVVVNRHQTIAELVTENTGYLFWLAVAGAALRFRQPVQLWLDRRFFREEYDREQLLLGLLDDLGRVDSIGQLSELVHAKLESALHPAGMYFWYRDPGEFAAASSSNPLLTPPDFPVEGRWLGWLEHHGTAAELPLPPEAGLSLRQLRWLEDRGVNLAIPIADNDERLAGVLLLGTKRSEEPYSANDRRLLLAIAKQAAVVRENLRLRAQVNDEQRIRHDVLARLDPHNLQLLKECPICGTCFDAHAERCDRDGSVLTMSLPVARTIEGKYRLDRLIGRGGMGAVYEAQDLRLNRPVAVKVLLGRAFGQQTALRRFRREARAAAKLDHPRIVRVFDYGPLEGEGAYIVMERLQGSTLRAELERVRTLRLADAGEWFDQILDGLAAAHAQGVVHRDLKPENIIGRRLDGQRLAVTLVDFGLAKEAAAESATTGTMTGVGVVMGTVGYMSPEQLLGQAVDHRTDVFAIGVMLAESLTGKRPFGGETPMDVAHAVLHQPYRLPGTSPELIAVDAVLQQCLAKEASMRCASADALRRALAQVLRPQQP